MNEEIELPSGKVITVPEGGTDEQIMNFAIKQGLAVEADFMPQQGAKNDSGMGTGGNAGDNNMAPMVAEQSFGREMLSGLELAGTVASAAAMEPVAGIAGLVAGAFNGPEKGAEMVRDVQGMAYEPRMPETKRALEGISKTPAVQGLASGMQYLEEKGGQAGEALFGGLFGTPGLGYAIGSAGPTAILEALGLKGVSTARGSKKITGISDDAIARMEMQGVEIDDLSDKGIKKLQSMEFERAAKEMQRLRLFERENIPTMQSRITQKNTDFLSERAGSRADTPEGQQIRDLAVDESAGFQTAINNYKNAFGDSEDVGDAVKSALRARQTGLKSDVEEAYKNLDEVTGGASIPLVGSKVYEALGDEKVQGMVGRLNDAERGQLNDLLIEFGIDTDPLRVERWIEARKSKDGVISAKSEITPLSINNSEDMAQALSAMMGFDASPPLKGVAGRIKKSIDDELTQFDELNGDGLAADVSIASKRARNAYKKLKDFENTDALIGKLIGSKKRSDEPLIYASEVAKRITGGGRDGSIENIDRLAKSLVKSDSGVVALGNMQAAVAAQLMDKSVSRTPLANGTRQWLAGNYVDNFDALDKSGKLSAIFRNNPEGLAGLRRLREASELTKAPSNVAKSSGTGDDNLNNIMKVIKGTKGLIPAAFQAGSAAVTGMPMAGEALSGVVPKSKQRAAKRSARRALNPRPDEVQQIQQLTRLYPNLVAAIAPSFINKAQQKEDKE